MTTLLELLRDKVRGGQDGVRLRAAAEIERLQTELAAAQVLRKQDANDILRLLETIKYVQGIAVRGEGRPQGDDETVEAFVLGYVKKLEARIKEIERALDEQMVVTGMGVFDPSDDPKAAIAMLMDWSRGVGAYFAGRKGLVAVGKLCLGDTDGAEIDDWDVEWDRAAIDAINETRAAWVMQLPLFAEVPDNEQMEQAK